MYATWGWKEGSETLAEHGWTREGITETIAREYRACGAANGSAVSPVGECFRDLMEITSEIDLYNPDLAHPSYEGSCLAAMMHYATVFGTLPKQTASLNLPADVTELFVQVVGNYLT